MDDNDARDMDEPVVDHDMEGLTFNDHGFMDTDVTVDYAATIDTSLYIPPPVTQLSGCGFNLDPLLGAEAKKRRSSTIKLQPRGRHRIISFLSAMGLYLF
jgi:hypothetical protein